MSYREENGQVVLTMPREDYEIVLMALGAFTSTVMAEELCGIEKMLLLLNRLNSGNPNYTPYEVKA
jgi:hypothetical protein